MAMVVREDGPPDDDTWEPRPIKKNAKGRKKGSDAALIRKFELGEKKRLSIKFDLHELRTAKPIGPNRRHFTGLIGNEIERSVPFCYESWDLVPDKHKGTIWPAINVWETNGVFPDLYRRLYKKKTHQNEGKWPDVFEARYIKMLKLRASQEGLEEKMTDDEIMDKVLGSSRAFKPGRGRNLPKSTSSSSVCNYPSPEPLVSKSALRRFVEAHNQQMKDWHAQLADKNIELRLPAPLDPNALLEDDAEPRDAADVLEDAANVLEDAAEPGEE
ncbi:hypothetical protein Tco_0275803 [Tanacetum coccineum]